MPGHDHVKKIGFPCRLASISFVLGLCIHKPTETRDEYPRQQDH
jgi:hypothetical protein